MLLNELVYDLSWQINPYVKNTVFILVVSESVL